jgi:hypothetical protein
MIEVKVITRLGGSVVVSQDTSPNAGQFVISVSDKDEACPSIGIEFDELKKFAGELFGAIAIWDAIRRMEFDSMALPKSGSVS